MTKRTPSAATRREFMRRTGALAMTGTAAPLALNLAGIAEAAAQTTSDYKALVCVFLYGGSDHLNTLIPYDKGTYDVYSKLRGGLHSPLGSPNTGGLAIPYERLASGLLTPNTSLTGGRQYALGPGLEPLMDLWKNGEMAALLNIGTLAKPTTKADYLNASHPKPPKLFSHNDQQSVWQTLVDSEGGASGWGGKLVELLASSNSKANSSFTAISVSGNAIFLSGKTLSPYIVSPSGPVQITALERGVRFGSTALPGAIAQLYNESLTSSLAQDYVNVVKRSVAANKTLRDNIENISSPVKDKNFTASKLGSQLSMVRKLISGRGKLGINKQVFFVGMGGFDHHADLIDKFEPMMREVTTAIAQFHEAMKQDGLGNQVTSFTASDFGRSNGNGSGSDHGWGGFHFVQGGAVNGKNFIGTPPVPGNNGPDDVGSGRMLPTLAVDQLARALGSWMGASDTNLMSIMPGAFEYNKIPLFR